MIDNAASPRRFGTDGVTRVRETRDLGSDVIRDRTVGLVEALKQLGESHAGERLTGRIIEETRALTGRVALRQLPVEVGVEGDGALDCGCHVAMLPVMLPSVNRDKLVQLPS